METASAPPTTRPGAEKYARNPEQLPEGTLVELFFKAVDTFRLPNAQMVRGEAEWKSISHEQLLDDVRSLAAALLQAGLQRGDRVALLSENRPEWALADYAMLCVGILNVPLYGTLPPGQIEFMMKDSETRAIFLSNADQLAKIEEIAANLPALMLNITFDRTGSASPRVRTLQEMIESGRKVRTDEASFRREATTAKPHDLATLIYTSGTTGTPKGVMLTHNNIFSNVLAQAWLSSGKGDDITLSFLPLSHIFQRMVDYCVFYHGIPIAYVPVIDDVARAIREIRPTVVCAVPRLYEKMYARILTATGIKRRLVLTARQTSLDWADRVLNGRKPSAMLSLKHRIFDRLVYSKIRANFGGRLRFFVSGAAPLNPQIARFFYGAGVLVLEGYGLTETSPVTNVNRPTEFRIGTVGRPIAATENRIAEDGEILVRGPQIMKGYYRNPAATAEMIDAEGWLHTGDIGDLDADGYLRITDRKKELIKTAGGKYVAPQPIQNLAKMSRFVAEAVLLGESRPFPIMLIVPDFATLESWAASEGIRWSSRTELVKNPRVHARFEQEMAERLKDLARFERPKKFLILDREFELDRGEITAKLSVKRKVVQEH